MQHPDEGTIHSWLDGALPAEEAGRVESHVVECPECSTAVAEARGFIAASSRILTALDDVPRGVVPVAPARKRDLRVLWRVAAAMLVVAGGSLVVLRDGGQDASVASGANESVFLQKSAAKGAGVEDSATEAPPQSDVNSDVNLLNQSAATPPAGRAGRPAASAERDLSGVSESRRASGSVAGALEQTIAAYTAAPTSAAMQLSAPTAKESSEVAPLKVLRVERTTGVRRTLYEIAPTQIVTLTEPEAMLLSGVVKGGVASVQERQIRLRGARSAEPMRAEAAAAPAAAPPMDFSRADSVTSKEVVPMSKTSTLQGRTGVAFSAAPNTISWTETATGKTLTLSGNLPVERLQEIKRRIERERAASSKKDP